MTPTETAKPAQGTCGVNTGIYSEGCLTNTVYRIILPTFHESWCKPFRHGRVKTKFEEV